MDKQLDRETQSWREIYLAQGATVAPDGAIIFPQEWRDAEAEAVAYQETLRAEADAALTTAELDALIARIAAVVYPGFDLDDDGAGCLDPIYEYVEERLANGAPADFPTLLADYQAWLTEEEAPAGGGSVPHTPSPTTNGGAPMIVTDVTLADLTPYAGSKFQLNVDQIAYAVVLDGWADESVGSCEYSGVLDLIVTGFAPGAAEISDFELSPADVAFLAQQRAAIVESHPSGAVYVEWFEDTDTAHDTYARLAPDYDTPSEDWG